MPIPRILHKVVIEIRQQNLGSTPMDEDAREPIQLVDQNSTVRILGQPKLSGAKEGTNILEFKRGGVEEGAAGYILFRVVDLNAKGITLQKNDNVIRIGHLEVDLYLHRIEWAGHYQDQNGATLAKAHLTDRRPGRNSPGGA